MYASLSSSKMTPKTPAPENMGHAHENKQEEL